MSRPKQIWFVLGASLALASLATESEPGAARPTSDNRAPVPQPLPAAVELGERVGFEQAQRVVMTVGSRELALLVPDGFRASLVNAEQVVLASAAQTDLIRIRLLAPPAERNISGLDAETARRWLPEHWGEVSVLSELSLSLGSASGPAFDLTAKLDRLTRSVRVAYIPTDFGVLEFAVVCSPETFAGTAPKLRYLMRGFQIGEPGRKLVFTPFRTDS